MVRRTSREDSTPTDSIAEEGGAPRSSRGPVGKNANAAARLSAKRVRPTPGPSLREGEQSKRRSRLCSCVDGAHRFRLRQVMDAQAQQELLRLLARESYFERDLTLASGRTSKYYIDCKRTLYLPRGAFLAGELMLELVTDEGIEQIGGMGPGGPALTRTLLVPASRHLAVLTPILVATLT